MSQAVNASDELRESLDMEHNEVGKLVAAFHASDVSRKYPLPSTPFPICPPDSVATGVSRCCVCGTLRLPLGVHVLQMHVPTVSGAHEGVCCLVQLLTPIQRARCTVEAHPYMVDIFGVVDAVAAEVRPSCAH